MADETPTVRQIAIKRFGRRSAAKAPRRGEQTKLRLRINPSLRQFNLKLPHTPLAKSPPQTAKKSYSSHPSSP